MEELRSNTHLSKTACWLLTKNPVDLISSPASMRVSTVLFEKLSPLTGSSLGTIATSFHLLLSKFAVNSGKSLCSIPTNRRLLQLTAC